MFTLRQQSAQVCSLHEGGDVHVAAAQLLVAEDAGAEQELDEAEDRDAQEQVQLAADQRDEARDRRLQPLLEQLILKTTIHININNMSLAAQGPLQPTSSSV